MCPTSAVTKTSSLGVAARIVTLLLIVGLAECAAGSCLSYGHSCWGAHGKRSGGGPVLPAGPEEAREPAATPGDTRWFLSKLVGRVEPGPSGGFKLWQRFGAKPGGESDGEAGDNGDARSAEDYSAMSPPEDSPDPGEVLLMATEDQPTRRTAHNLRVYKIMNQEARKLD